MSYGSWHYARCEDCGCNKLTRQNGGYAVLCKECKQERRKTKDKRYNDRRGFHHTSGSVDSIVIVYDPTPYCEGGYSIGAKFDRMQVSCMLQATYCGFTAGTKVKNADGDVFVIKLKKGGKGSMELCPM